MAKSTQQSDSADDSSPVLRVRAHADQLYRAAGECVRQRERYASLISGAAHDEELDATGRLVSLCDELLDEAVRAYEDAVARDGGAASEAWWHQANALWMASREYGRRHREVEQSSRRFGDHSRSKLTELALQYDLEASSLLALSHALAAYRRCCPEAENAGQLARRARAS